MKFQDCILIGFVTDARTDARTDKPKAICPFNFFKVGGIKTFWIRACADPEGGAGAMSGHPPERSQKYRVSKQYWSGSPVKPQRCQDSVQCWADDDPLIEVSLSLLIN